MQTAKRILLVEDDVDDQFLFCEALKELHSHIDCQIANDGVEALQLIRRSSSFDLIFLDLNMPRINGLECLVRIKENPLHKHIPVIVLSTTNRPEVANKCTSLGAHMFVSKPTTFKELFCQLQNILSNVVETADQSPA